MGVSDQFVWEPMGINREDRWTGILEFIYTPLIWLDDRFWNKPFNIFEEYLKKEAQEKEKF